MRLLWVVLLVTLVVNAQCAISTVPFNTTVTYYPQFYSGACGLQITSADDDVMTPITNSFDWLRCGTCYKVQRIGGSTSVVVRVSDWCSTADCGTTDYAGLRQGSFTAIGCTGGRCNVTMQVVECNTAPYQGGNLALYAMSWVNNYTLAFIPLNPLVQITAIQVNLGGTLYNMTQNNQAAWSLPNILCAGKSFYLLITSVEGETIQTQNFLWPNVPPQGDQIYQINKQFTLNYNSGGTTAPGTTNPGTTNPGTTNPGTTTNPGSTVPGTTSPTSSTTKSTTTSPSSTTPQSTSSASSRTPLALALGFAVFCIL